LFIALAERQDKIDPSSPGWFGVWLVIQMMNTPPGLLLLMSKVWRSYPLSYRMNLAFGYLGLSWCTLLAFVIAITKYMDTTFEFAFMMVLACVLALIYLFLRKTKAEDPEEMFP
jgi:hypothetical protein